MIHIQEIFARFWKCSGLRINFNKSDILPLFHARLPPWAEGSIFLVAKTHITYLGAKIGKSPSLLYHLNFPPVLNRISAELETWHKLPLSFFEKCNLFKMVSFPKLLYLLQTIPLLLKHLDLQKLQKALNTFIWQGHRPWIAIQKLYLPKHEGGVNLPNIRLYNLSSLVRRFRLDNTKL